MAGMELDRPTRLYTILGGQDLKSALVNEDSAETSQIGMNFAAPNNVFSMDTMPCPNCRTTS